MAGARWRLFCPGHAGFQPRHPAFQLKLVFIENPGGGRLHTAAAVAGLRIDHGAHGVVDILAQQVQPVAELPVVQQIGFVVEKLGDFVVQLNRHRGQGSFGKRAHFRISCWNCWVRAWTSSQLSEISRSAQRRYMPRAPVSEKI